MTLIVGFGNALLDITIQIKDKKLLNKYNLKDDDQKEITENEMKSLLNDIKNYQQKTGPGGCAQNTLRILQWIIKKPNATVIIGSIGNDWQGEQLKNLVQNDNVITRYTEHNQQPTGTSVALVNNTNRSLVAYLGAAEYLTINNIKLNENFLIDSTMFYMEGYFLTKRLDVAKYILNYCKQLKKTFVFNLSGAYMIENEPENMHYFANECDILFGNRNEYLALTKQINFNGSVENLAIHLVKTSKRNKIIVITDGPNNVFCAHGDGNIETIEVPKLESDQIKDTTGAGDSFAAGFLAALLKNNNIKTALKWGCWVSSQIIQNFGCKIPNVSTDYLNKLK